MSTLTEGLAPVPHSSTDSSNYAAFLFNAFDTNHDGSVSFEVS